MAKTPRTPRTPRTGPDLLARALLGWDEARAEVVAAGTAPRELFAAAQRGGDAAEALEAVAIRLALEQCDGFVKRAAEVLGLGRSTLDAMLRANGRHAALGQYAQELRAALGYTGGNPNMSVRKP